MGRAVALASAWESRADRPRPLRRDVLSHALTPLLCVLFAIPAGGAWCEERELARKLLEWPRDLPNVEVEVPVEVYRKYLESRLLPPPQPPAPVPRVVSYAEYAAGIKDDMLRLNVRVRVTTLDPRCLEPLRLLPAGPAWEHVEINGEAVALRQDESWFYLDDPRSARPRNVPDGPYEIVLTAQTDLRAGRRAGVYEVAIPIVPAVLSVLKADSEQAWEVSATRALMTVVGTADAGTHGALALMQALPVQAAPKARQDRARAPLSVTWRRPRPPITRTGTPLYDCRVAWHLGEGLQEVRAALDVRIAGGARDSLVLELPPGADRVEVTGPDVRTVNLHAGSATVALNGRISGATTLSVQFAISWPARRGRTSLSGFGLAGGRLRGGTLIVTSDTGGVVLEEDITGLNPLGLWQVPRATSALSPSPPLLAYAVTREGWHVGVDLVRLAELPVRETLIDEAHYTVLLRPGGQAMHKAVFQVRNRHRQFLRLRLPGSEDRLMLSHVSGEPVTVARGRDGELLIPMEQSVETLAGGLSFPVEVVYLSRVAPLARTGRLSLPLARVDIPTARARCTLYAPEGLRVAKWQGTFTVAEKLAATVREMEYGRGHRASTAQIAEVPPSVGAGLAGERLLADNYYLSLMGAYQKGQIERAEEEAGYFIEQFKKDPRAGDVSKLLDDIRLLKGKKVAKTRADRAQFKQLGQAFLSQTQKAQFGQQDLLRHGWHLARQGDEAGAAQVFRAAEEAGRALRINKDMAAQQDAVLAEARKWLRDYGETQEANRELRRELARLKQQRKAPTDGVSARDQVRATAGPAAEPSAAAATARELQRDIERIRRRGADAWSDAGDAYEYEETTMDTDDATRRPQSNVEAPGQIAFQRAAGKGARVRLGPSATLENIRLKEELRRFEGGQAAVGGPAPEAPRPATPEEQLKSVKEAARELVRQKRFAEATELLGRATTRMRPARPPDQQQAEPDDLHSIQAEVEHEWRTEGANTFLVMDLAENRAEGRRLAEFVASNYARPVGESADVAPDASVQYFDGQLVTRGDFATERVAKALENLRRNKGQKVTANTRGLSISERAAADLGVRWNTMQGGNWAVVDEAQLNALLTREQRASTLGVAVSKGQFEIVPGTGQRMANSASVQLDMARDVSNGLVVNGAAVELPHEKVLLVSANGRIVALRAGATQHWTEAPEAPEIEEVPMEINVPAVGTPVRFESVLVDPQDELVIECNYRFKEEAHNAR